MFSISLKGGGGETGYSFTLTLEISRGEEQGCVSRAGASLASAERVEARLGLMALGGCRFVALEVWR